MQPFNAFLSGFSATVGQFVLTGRFSFLVYEGWRGMVLTIGQRRCGSRRPRGIRGISRLFRRSGKSDLVPVPTRTVKLTCDAFRAFADYVVCSLILHFFCVNFIN